MAFKMKGFTPFTQKTAFTQSTQTTKGQICTVCGMPISGHPPKQKSTGPGVGVGHTPVPGTIEQYLEKNKPKKISGETDEQYKIRVDQWKKEQRRMLDFS